MFSQNGAVNAQVMPIQCPKLRGNSRWKSGLEVLVGRFSDRRALNVEPDRAVQILFTLTSFETLDSLAANDPSLTEIEGEVLTLAESIWK
jgi:hypothetical protein